jgi:ankyrin repeat protein
MWIEHLKKTETHLPSKVEPVIRSTVRMGRTEIVKFLESRCGMDSAEWRFNNCIEAVKSGQLNTLRWLLDCGGCGLKMQTDRCKKGPLFAALHDCPPTMKPRVVKVLLTHRVDPNEVCPKSPQTPLQTALKKGDIHVATLLVEYGAVVNPILPSGRRCEESPTLLLAAKRGSAPMVQLLLDKGVDRSYKWKSKRLVVRNEVRVIQIIENIFVELGWDEKGVKDEHMNYFMVDH